MELKKKTNTLIMAHNYQRPEVQDVADILGDSLELARLAANVNEERILLCGVRFMAESAKIVAPQKTVLTPEKEAGCPMADMITADDIRSLRKTFPRHLFMAYVNTSAEVKAEVDLCCTSSNALDLVRKLEGQKIFFLPDKNLGAWIKDQTGADMEIWPGFCYVHNRIRMEDLQKGRAEYPEAEVLVHPESPLDVLKAADAVLSTGQMIAYARESEKKSFLVGTEEGMIYRLGTLFPDKAFYPMGRLFTCENMKKVTLEKVLHSLLTGDKPVEVEPEIIRRASRSLGRMLEMS
jgi:quinolinate synthase